MDFIVSKFDINNQYFGNAPKISQKKDRDNNRGRVREETHKNNLCAALYDLFDFPCQQKY